MAIGLGDGRTAPRLQRRGEWRTRRTQGREWCAVRAWPAANRGAATHTAGVGFAARMHLENVPRLREYLVQRLRPLTEAEPEALADYTIALLRHDKGDGAEMQAFCARQLREFMRADADADAFAAGLLRYVHSAGGASESGAAGYAPEYGRGAPPRRYGERSVSPPRSAGRYERGPGPYARHDEPFAREPFRRDDSFRGAPESYRGGRGDQPDTYRGPRSDQPDTYRGPRNDQPDGYRGGRNDPTDSFRGPRNDPPDSYRGGRGERFAEPYRGERYGAPFRPDARGDRMDARDRMDTRGDRMDARGRFAPPSHGERRVVRPFEERTRVPDPAATLHVDCLPSEMWKISVVAARLEAHGNLRSVSLRGPHPTCRAEAEFVRPVDAARAAGNPALFGVEGVRFWVAEGAPIAPPPTIESLPVPERQREAIRNMAELQQKKHEMLAKNLEARAELQARLDGLAPGDADAAELAASVSRLDDLIRSLGGVPPGSERRAPPPAAAPAPGRFSALTLDLRSTALAVRPLPPALGTEEAARAFFGAHGALRDLSLAPEGATVSFERRADAERALAALGAADLGAPFAAEWASPDPSAQ